jgi:membrane-associated phospholipid phosphatase
MSSPPRTSATGVPAAAAGGLKRAALSVHALVGAADRSLPRGTTHLCLQFLVWVAFYFAYNITRGLADRNVAAAFDNGEWIARTEARLGTLFEPWLQQAFATPLMTTLMSYTYWLSQFVVVAVALFWVYLRRHETFAFFRNWLIVANLTGLVCYIVVPTAPPRMLPHWGFTDTLATTGSIDHGSVDRLANQYAAMPSLHVMDALIVGLTLFFVVRPPVLRLLWLVWPAWVTFAVLATGNHYWLDIAAGVLIAGLSALALRPGSVARAWSRWRTQRAPALRAHSTGSRR